MPSFQPNDGPARAPLARASRRWIRRAGWPTRRRWNAGPAAQRAALTPTWVHRGWENRPKRCRGKARCRTSTARCRSCRRVLRSSGCQVLRRAATVLRGSPAANSAAFLHAADLRQAPTTRAAAAPAAVRAAAAPRAAGGNGARVGARAALPRSQLMPPTTQPNRWPLRFAAAASHGPQAAGRPRSPVMRPGPPNPSVASTCPAGFQWLGRRGADVHSGPLLPPHTAQRRGSLWRPRQRRRAGRHTPPAGNYPRPAAAAAGPAVPPARR